MGWNELEAIGTAVGAVFAGIALVMTVVLQRQQLGVAGNIHREQQLLAKRQLVLPLWEYLSKVPDINPVKPVWPDVIAAVNTLELVAILYEGGMIDPAVIERTFASQYLHLGRQIQQCTSPPEGLKSGPNLLAENRAASTLFRKLEQEDSARGKLNTI